MMLMISHVNFNNKYKKIVNRKFRIVDNVKKIKLINVKLVIKVIY